MRSNRDLEVDACATWRPTRARSIPRRRHCHGSLGLENPAELGALWAGNPDLQHVPIPESGGEWPSVLSCDLGTRSESQRDTEVTTPGVVTSLLMLPGETGADLDRVIARYPTLAGARAVLNEFEVNRPAGADELVGRVGPDGRGAALLSPASALCT